eukprot:TRINITY_DN14695_c0_g1_i2.p1 TRINITY_DN14695_c0_g1~~TRINITY_DN14695_c0_g1_i2.p1  ORF type:complete len:136 (-),score=19.93 TRINITY_DN14695_c0_g1_i2:1036-1443(-)
MKRSLKEPDHHPVRASSPQRRTRCKAANKEIVKALSALYADNLPELLNNFRIIEESLPKPEPEQEEVKEIVEIKKEERIPTNKGENFLKLEQISEKAKKEIDLDRLSRNHCLNFFIQKRILKAGCGYRSSQLREL